jgi:hypothetical protein
MKRKGTILCVAITGQISNDFSLKVISNGYVAAPSGADVGLTALSATAWQSNVVNETFYKADLTNSYGPQPTRPASAYQDLYPGQAGATGYLMFVDLGVANRINGQSDQVLFDIKGLYAGNVLALSAYGYDLGKHGNSDVRDAIGWTTPTIATGFTVTGDGATPVPVPPSVLLLAGGLGGLGVIRKKWITR